MGGWPGMSDEPKEMDEERLAALVEEYESGRVGCYDVGQDEDGPDFGDLLGEVLDDRDHWEADAAALKREVKASRELREDMERRMMLAQSEARKFRSLAAKGVYSAACVLADLGPRGSKATRSDREDAVRVLVDEVSKDRSHISRCPVEASDVEAAGVTHVGCWRWFRRLGFSQSGPTATCGFFHLIGNWGPVVAHGYVHTSWTSEDIARLVNTTSWRAPAATVLDEMAALENDAEV